MRVVGYARVSMQDPNLDSQTDALRAAGAEFIYSDRLTGKNAARPGLADCMEFLCRGDTLLVRSADRLGRSMADVVSIASELGTRGVEFKSLTEPFDTTAAGGELFFDICTAFAQMNGRIISDRTRAGLASARARGRLGGRPAVMTPERIEIARRMRAEKATWAAIAQALQVGMSSVRRALADADQHDLKETI
ncbi:DNA invertase Pin-like site-specific DNA recombinase [Cryobacterium sp. MP_M5]|uniref:recombinase family protein n=1 Tax=unclassified Cryobacterium TaxID=2649013 RepID=UPI0018CB862F|nr:MULTISPECIES: recombinase family protein [unclassified Cryobacterium]MBG6059769.1 DNA invertase Pin-like site-specific DNA recombinase [Cryobacterium sp. MP_M3]MEC5178152.1 DNA invertase Pin-like site-specific DNA recombinase [Cryobacterium sp. MP_M5]